MMICLTVLIKHTDWYSVFAAVFPNLYAQKVSGGTDVYFLVYGFMTRFKVFDEPKRTPCKYFVFKKHQL
ncbi:unnamed protein product, partial [Fusarium graminearum]